MTLVHYGYRPPKDDDLHLSMRIYRPASEGGSITDSQQYEGCRWGESCWCIVDRETGEVVERDSDCKIHPAPEEG